MGENLYTKWMGEDLYTYLEPLINTGGAVPRFDGKFDITLKFDSKSPWEHIKVSEQGRCMFAHDILFNCVATQLPMGFVPLACQNCFKVVIRPKTIRELFSIREMMIGMDRPSKLGIELRIFVHGLYGCYFYNHGLREGLECYKAVRANLDAIGMNDTPALLKRGCTEMEMKCGDSLKWTPITGQDAVEKYIRNHLVIGDIGDGLQPEEWLPHIHTEWVKWAYQHGDETYKDFTDGRPLFHPYRTYHHLVNASGKKIKKFMEG